ncbi:hypothetical protein [Jiangella endophytica]|uniref:hypothetical protein n=1 Tax=Jiangella endophytica TaxID=1623398 RepID=UPI0018E53253|nr:hypothetical protein [Jiangella endophytica]
MRIGHVRRRRASRAALTALTAAVVLPMAATAFAAGQQAGTILPALDTEPVADGAPSSSVIHLITGHEVHVTTTPAGEYQVSVPGTPDGAPAADLQVRAEEAPGQAPALVADPAGTVRLVDEGRVDPHLFDLSYLIEHGYTGAPTPVTVYFNGAVGVADVSARAEALPGSEPVPGTVTEDRATVTVAAGSGETFWDAVTEDPDDQPYAPRELADGVAAITLDGAARPDAVEPNATVPTARLTIRVHGSQDQSRWYHRPGTRSIAPQGWATAYAEFYLSSVTGLGGATRALASGGEGCADPSCVVRDVVVDLPEGTWFLDGHAVEFKDSRGGYTWFVEPEVVVDGDTTIDLYVDDATWIEPDTPRPTELAHLAVTKQRIRPDGTRFTNLHFLAGDGLTTGMWLAPTRWPATTGAFNALLTQQRQQPRISMAVTQPKVGLDLRTEYGPKLVAEDYLAAEGDTFELVDVGAGSPADFSRIDARGKLALVAPFNAVTGCATEPELYERAADAGVVALVFDPHDDYFIDAGRCYAAQSGAPGGLPDLSVTAENAADLRDLLERDRVMVEVDSPRNQRMEYVYTLAQHFYGGIPDDIDQTVTDRDLTVRESRLHDTAGLGSWTGSAQFGPVISLESVARTDVMNIIGGSLFDNLGIADESVNLTEYIGPVSPDIIWTRGWQTERAKEDSGATVLEAPSRRGEHWFTSPRAIGPAESTGWCSFCRAGDVLYSFGERTPGAEPQHTAGTVTMPDGVLTDSVGDVIPASTVNRVRAYVLPAQSRQYTLTGSDSSGNEYEWTFTSGTAGDNRPPGVTCIPELYFAAPCGEPVPMIYLRHVTPVDIENTAAAGTRHTVEIVAFHQAPGAPQINRPSVQVSFDGGTTWHDTRVLKGTRGGWQVRFTVPPLARTNGFVALRTAADDVEGNSTIQTLWEAYALR